MATPIEGAGVRDDLDLSKSASKAGGETGPEHSLRATEEMLAQRLYSILLAAHAAEANLARRPDRLAATLELIRLRSIASLEDIRHLATLR